MKLAVFDIDGTLRQEVSPWRFLHKTLGVGNIASNHYQAYLRGELDYNELSRRDASLWRSVPKRDMINALKNNPYRPGASDLVKWFLERGYDTLAISSGLDVLNAVACEDLGIAKHISNKLNFDSDDACLGTVQIHVNETNKGDILKRYLENAASRYNHIFAVGDGAGDIPMFRVADFSLAFMPVNDDVRQSATYSAESFEDSKSLLDIFYRRLSDTPARSTACRSVLQAALNNKGPSRGCP